MRFRAATLVILARSLPATTFNVNSTGFFAYWDFMAVRNPVVQADGHNDTAPNSGMTIEPQPSESEISCRDPAVWRVIPQSNCLVGETL